MAFNDDIEYVRPATVYDAFGHAHEAPVEEVTKAAAGHAAGWGSAEHHNLSDGARASGNVVSAHSLLPSADLNWDPEFRPLVTMEGFDVPADVGRAVVRSDNGRPIGVVGARYALIPHRMLADLADAICGASDDALRYGNAGHKANGARPFLQLKSSPRVIGRDVRSSAVEVSDVITLLTSHDGSLQAMACYSANIIVCDNTYAHALSASKARGISIRHTAGGVETLKEAIRIAEKATEAGHSFNAAALKLIAAPFSDDNMRLLASSLVPAETTRAENERAKLMDAWVSSPGAAPGTAWGASQAVTWWTTHAITTRGETDRAFGLATGEGRGADVQAQAWWHLRTDEGTAALRTVKLLRC